MAKDYILSIDQGTTGSTVLIFDRESQPVGRGYSEFTQYFPQAGWVEHDAEEIWRVTYGVIEAGLADAGIGAGDLHAVGITNQRETVVLWERDTGRPVAPAIVWQDRRTAAFCDELKKAGREPLFREKTGLLLDPYFSGTKIRWYLDNLEGIRTRAEKGELACGTIDSWLVWNLTGGKVHVTDCTNASRTLLYNIKDNRWDDELLGVLDIPPGLLPEVKASSCIYGETNPGSFMGVSVPLGGLAGDQHAALFGQACFEPGTAKNTYGTGSFLLMNTGNRPARSEHRLLTTIAWQLEGSESEYALEGSIFITGAAVQWLRDGLGIIKSAKETEKLATSVDFNEGVYFVPALTGLGAPHWDPYARGTLLGITRGTTSAHLCRAVLESIGYQTRDVLEAMKCDADLNLKALRADGGGTVNRFLMQFQSDILGIPVEVPDIAETTALGAAYLAGLSTGFWKNRDDLSTQWTCASRYEPGMKDDERDRLYSRWQEAVERAKGWEQPG